MADTVQRLMERSLDELEDLQVRGIFSPREIKAIVKKRTDFEYRVNARAPEKADYLRYIRYEHTLDALRRKRKARLALGPAGASDFAMERRVHFIFNRALKKFQGDLALWNQYIEYAMSSNSTSRLNKIFPQALRLHPTSAQLWIKAAVWEHTHNRNISTARMHMQRAIRLNGSHSDLWIEYFRLELDYVRMLRRRREALGMDPSEPLPAGAPAAAPAEAASAERGARGAGADGGDLDEDLGEDLDEDDEELDLDVDEAEAAANAEARAAITAEIARVNAMNQLLVGGVPFIVYTNMCQKVPDASVDFHMLFLRACGHAFPWVVERILVHCKQAFGDSVAFWDAYARLPQEEVAEHMAGGSGGDVDGFEISAGDAADKARADAELVAGADAESAARFEQALATLPTPPMWTRYLEWRIERAEGADGADGNDSKRGRGGGGAEGAAAGMDAATLTRVLEAFAVAHSRQCLEAGMYRHWVRLMMLGGRTGAVDVAQAAVEAHPGSVLAWKLRLNLAQHVVGTQGGGEGNDGAGQRMTKRRRKDKKAKKNKKNKKKQRQEEVEQLPHGIARLHALFEVATDSVDTGDASAWELEAMWAELQSTVHAGNAPPLKAHISAALLRMCRRRHSPDAIVAFFRRVSPCLDLAGFREVADAAVASGQVFVHAVPVAFFRTMIGREMEEEDSTLVERVRKVFGGYTAAHAQSLTAWLDYARFELSRGHGDTKAIADLDWHARKALGEHPWQSEFAKARHEAVDRS